MNIEKDLIGLNKESVEVEQRGGDEAHKFFDDLLSNQLIFRRANGKVVDKAEFLKGFEKPGSPFASRDCGLISVTPLNDRALVTLIVSTRAEDDSVKHYRNIRLFSKSGGKWLMEFWYNYEIAGL